jgi:hypothetical protein
MRLRRRRQALRANHVSELPTRDTDWPNQTIRNVRYSFCCRSIISAAFWLSVVDCELSALRGICRDLSGFVDCLSSRLFDQFEGIVLLMIRLTACIALALVLAACSPVSRTSSDTVDASSVPNETTTSVVATTTADSGPEDFCLAGDLPFVESGLAAAIGNDVGDAAQIEQIRLDQAPTCERLTIEFTNDSGAPATSIGPTGVTVLDFAGLVRVAVPPEITTTAIADTLFEGVLVRGATVVRADDESLTIDIRGSDGTPILARAFATTSPASLVIDIATSQELPEPAGVTVSTPAVVVSPVPGPSLYPLTVEGYAAPGLHSLRIQLGTEDSTDVDLSIALSGDNDAWQGFRTSIVDGPSGSSTLFVGTVDGNDQPLEGASVLLNLP